MLLETPLGEGSLDSDHGPSRLCSYTRSLLWSPLSPSAQIHLPGMRHGSPCLVLAAPHFLFILGFVVVVVLVFFFFVGVFCSSLLPISPTYKHIYL